MIFKKIKRKIENVSYTIRGIFEYNFLGFFCVLVPRRVMINLTYGCNSRCVMCNIWKREKTKEMGIEDWKKAIKDNLFKKIRLITLSGGEAMLHKDFLEITKLFIKDVPKLRELVVITNGLIPDHVFKTVELLAKQCCKKDIILSIVVSLDGIDKLHDFTRGTIGAARKSQSTLFGLKKLKEKYNFNLTASSLVLRQNLCNVGEMEKWFKKKGINYSFQIVGFHDTFIKNLDTQKNVDFTIENKGKLLSVLQHFSLKERQKKEWPKSYFWKDIYEMYANNRSRTTPCPFLKDQLVIDCLGDVYYCLSEKKIGNFLEEKKSLLEIYKDKKNIDFRKKLRNGPCLKCNSACDVNEALTKDFKKILWFRLTGKLMGNGP